MGFSLTRHASVWGLAASVFGCSGATTGDGQMSLGDGGDGTSAAVGGDGPGASAGAESTTTGNGEGGSDSGGAATGGAGVEVPTLSDPSQITRIARLSHSQYQNTVEQLLGITDGPANGFAPDALNGFAFDTSIDFRVDARLGPQYRAAAEELGARVVSDAEVFDRIVTCDTADAACGPSFIASFGQRAFRRPLTDAEQARFEALFARGAELLGSGDAFRDGVQLVVEALLESPQFLYRTELNSEVGADGQIALDSWEVASRLSYFIWGSMPDDELFAQASRGELGSVEQVASAAERLLGDERAVRQMVSFHDQAWQFSRFERIVPDADTFPDVPDDIIPRVRSASTQFVRDVVENGGGLVELLTAPYAYADSSLARIYGTEAGDDIERIDFDPTERKGYLMQIGFLASHSYSVKTDPIHRGLFVARNLLCLTIPDPPPGASTSEPPEATGPIETTRDEVELLTGQQDCVSCHSLINPPGFAFEGFDAVGQRRTSENDVEVDTSGAVFLDGATVTFGGALPLVDALAASADVRRCYSSKWLEYAYGRNLLAADAATTDQVALTPQSVAAIIAQIATTTPFLKRAPNEVGP